MLSLDLNVRNLAFEVLEYVECEEPGATVAQIALVLKASVDEVFDAIASDTWLMIEGPADDPDQARVFMSLA